MLIIHNNNKERAVAHRLQFIIFKKIKNAFNKNKNELCASVLPLSLFINLTLIVMHIHFKYTYIHAYIYIDIYKDTRTLFFIIKKK